MSEPPTISPVLSRRHFLGWDGPLPDKVAAWLVNGAGEGVIDLSDCLVLVPTQQAGRILREELARRAADRGRAVLAPEIVTPEAFVAGMAAAAAVDFPVAGEIEALAAWAHVLTREPLAEFSAVFPVPPPVADLNWALVVARQLQQARSTLAEGGRSFGLVGASDDVPETLRWKQLAALEALYLTELRRAGRWDAAAAQLHALEQPVWPWAAERIVLAGVSDALPISLRLIAAVGRPVDVLVWAPERRSGWFDAMGTPLPAAWEEADIELHPAFVRVHPLADPATQAEKVATFLVAHAAPERTLALAVADPSLARPVERAVRARGTAVFRPEGTPASQHGCLRLLATWREALSGEWAAWVRLLRVPCVLSALGKDAKLLREADAFQLRHFPLRLEDVESLADESQPAEVMLRAVAGTVLRQLRAFGRGKLPAALAAWWRWLFPRGVPADWTPLVEEADALVAQIEVALPSATRSEQLALLASVLGRERLPAEREDGALELGGWLELPWRSGPHAVVAGCNDAFVPAAPAPDPFLPDGLREKLGLRCHRTRVARDAHWLTAVIESRRAGGRVDLLFGQTGAGEEALRPSRLLLRCPDAELPARVQHLFHEAAPLPVPAPVRAWKLRPLATAAEATPAKLGVTSFATYLACPFRFFLKHVLRMRDVDATRRELDALAFGNLCHSAFEDLARDEKARRSHDEGAIRACLLASLEATVRREFGPRQPLSLLLQVEAARQRLTKAAEIQARVQREGWVIEAVEQDLAELRGSPYVLEGVEIRGRVDRLERNLRTGEWRIIDYKTSSKAKQPEDAHTMPAGDKEWPEWRVLPDGARVWTGLQLPLYGAALTERYGPDYRAAYFNLPKAVGETELHDWVGLDPAVLASAVACAEGVLSAIRGHVFWPPAEKPPFDDFADLWLQGPTATCERPDLVTGESPRPAPAGQLSLNLFGDDQP